MNGPDSSSRIFLSGKPFLILICSLLLLRLALTVFMPVADPSEARYAAIGANMCETGNFLQPRFVHDGVMQDFEGKPPLFFQAGGAFCKLLGVSAFAVRFPAFLSALAILGLVFWGLRKLKTPDAGAAGVVFCLLSAVFYLFAGLAMTDLMLAASVVGAVAAYMLFTSEERRRNKRLYSIVFFASLGVGMLVKGPVAVVMAGMPVFLYVLINKKWKELKDHAWISGTAVFLLIALPWYWTMAGNNPGFLEYFFVNENFKRFLFKEYGDRYGSGRETFRGMALVWFLLSNIPVLFLLVFPAWSRKDAKEFFAPRIFRDPLEALSALGVLSITLFWCLSDKVLITYLLPTIPFAAMFLASRFDSLGYFRRDGFRRALRTGIPLTALAFAAAFLAVSSAGPYLAAEMPGPAYAAAVREAERRGLGDVKFYFFRRTPYSAGFHLGNRVVNHPKEDASVSLANSRGAILFVKDKDHKRLGGGFSRERLVVFGKWNAYAPEKNAR